MIGPRPSRNVKIDQDLELCCETLEPRQMLAGDVTASLNAAGELTVKGNGRSNNVNIYNNGRGEIIVEASSYDGKEDNEKRESDREDNSDFYSFDSEDVTKIKVRLKGGNDYLSLQDYGDRPSILRDEDSSSRIDVDVKLGGGRDEAYFYGNLGDVKSSSEYSYFSAYVGDLAIKGNELNMYGTSANSLTAKLKGDAYVNIDRSHFDGMVDVKTGGGNDSIQVRGSSFDDDVDVKTKGGEDNVNVYGIYNGYYYYQYNSFYGDVDVKLGGGDDYLGVSRSNFFGSEITLNGNGGNDGGDFQYEIGLYDGAILNEPISFEFADR